MCGANEEFLTTIIIEGTKLNVCEKCTKFGIEVVKPSLPKLKPPKRKSLPEEESVEFVTENYSELIKSARENLKLNQKEFAALINEKESLVHALECGHLTPSLELAKKLEKSLNIKLVEEYKKEIKEKQKKKEEELTLGDLIKVKKE